MKILSTSSWAVLLIGLFMFTYYAWLEPFYVTYSNGYTLSMSGTIQKTFRRGQPILFHKQVCKTKSVIGVEVRELYNQDLRAVYPLPTIPTGLFDGCGERSLIVTFPIDLPPGHYEYRVWSAYQVNALRQDVYISPPIAFEVLSDLEIIL